MALFIAKNYKKKEGERVENAKDTYCYSVYMHKNKINNIINI